MILMGNQSEFERQNPGFLFSLALLVTLGLFFISCTSKPEKSFSYQPSANAADEIRNLQVEMDQAEGEQIAVLAPKSYPQAHRAWVKARTLQESGRSNSEVLRQLSEARSYFEQAKETARQSLSALPEVISARENALISGAQLYHRPELERVDRRLTNLTEDFEGGKGPKLTLKERTELQQRYLDLEVAGIKSTRLGDVWSTIEAARKMGAQRYAPRTLNSALVASKNAEMTIQNNRHNDPLITAATNEAQREAKRLLKVTGVSKQSGRAGNEALAIQIVDRDQKISLLNERMMTEEARRNAQASQYQQQLQEAQRSTAAAQQSQTEAARKLEAQQKIAAMYAEASSQFSKDEADVYRQGENLIIRLKSIQFPVGRADVPAASFRVLNKVGDVIEDMQAGRVIIEGHTDATGDPEFNLQLSQERANAVAQYLERDLARQSGSGTDAETEGPLVEARGFGYEYPIVSNKTKEGRAKNRRVDVVITPEMVVQ